MEVIFRSDDFTIRYKATTCHGLHFPLTRALLLLQNEIVDLDLEIVRAFIDYLEEAERYHDSQIQKVREECLVALRRFKTAWLDQIAKEEG